MRGAITNADAATPHPAPLPLLRKGRGRSAVPCAWIQPDFTGNWHHSSGPIPFHAGSVCSVSSVVTVLTAGIARRVGDRRSAGRRETVAGRDRERGSASRSRWEGRKSWRSSVACPARLPLRVTDPRSGFPVGGPISVATRASSNQQRESSIAPRHPLTSPLSPPISACPLRRRPPAFTPMARFFHCERSASGVPSPGGARFQSARSRAPNDSELIRIGGFYV